MERLPRATWDNAVTATKYYAEQAMSERAMRMFYAAVGNCLHTTVHFQPADETGPAAEEMISDGQKNGLVYLIIHNHQHDLDPGHMGSGFENEPALRDFRFTTDIASKPGNFNFNKKMPILGFVVRHLGVVLVLHRPQDAPRESGGKALEGNNDYRVWLNEELQIPILQDVLNGGRNLVVYAEGTRYKLNTKGKKVRRDDPRELLKVRDGIGQIACGVKDPSRVNMLCFGTVYDTTSHHLRSVTYIMRPFPVADSVEGVVSETEEVLQRAVNRAYLLEKEERKPAKSKTKLWLPGR